MAVEGTGIDKEEIFLIFKSVPKKKKKEYLPSRKRRKYIKKKSPRGEK